MRTAISIGKVKGEPVLIGKLSDSLISQKERFKKIAAADGKFEGIEYEEIQLWESSSGLMKRKKFSKPLIESKDNESKDNEPKGLLGGLANKFKGNKGK